MVVHHCTVLLLAIGKERVKVSSSRDIIRGITFLDKLDGHTLKGDSCTTTKILLLSLSMELQRQPLSKVSSRPDFILRNVQPVPAHVVLGKNDEKKPVFFVELQVFQIVVSKEIREWN